MSQLLSYRLATIDDAQILLAWRNDPETRKASHDMSEVTVDHHIAWLSKTLADTDRKLFVAEADGMAVGTVRADLSEGAWLLSWAVNPGFRGQGIAKSMVVYIASKFSDPIRAEVKSDNAVSAKIAESAGMVLEREVNGICYFFRDALK